MRTESRHTWGRLKTAPSEITELRWPDQPFPKTKAATLLPIGLGRSYGDSALNPGGALCLTADMNLVHRFNPETGVLTCGGGTSIDRILTTFVPKGWFPPVVPGTKFVTVAGAIANDIHGKNHHLDGTWCEHVLEIELLRSDTGRIRCSRAERPEMFAATCGGLGLTGIITEVVIQLKTLPSSWIHMESLPFHTLNQFSEINQASDRWAYTVAWLDMTSPDGRGIYMRGAHKRAPDHLEPFPVHRPTRIKTPVTAPNWVLNRFTVKTFNATYRACVPHIKTQTVHYDPFFFPLDRIGNWNLIYGRRGFFQYQCVLPHENGNESIKTILANVAKHGCGSFLAVLKTFGKRNPAGPLSFPMEGCTLAMDFPNNGAGTHKLFDALDQIVNAAGGRLYPAKDARMAGDNFRLQYPEWQTVEKLRDPRITSGFWNRVTR